MPGRPKSCAICQARKVKVRGEYINTDPSLTMEKVRQGPPGMFSVPEILLDLPGVPTNEYQIRETLVTQRFVGLAVCLYGVHNQYKYLMLTVCDVLNRVSKHPI